MSCYGKIAHVWTIDGGIIQNFTLVVISRHMGEVLTTQMVCPQPIVGLAALAVECSFDKVYSSPYIYPNDLEISV